MYSARKRSAAYIQQAQFSFLVKINRFQKVKVKHSLLIQHCRSWYSLRCGLLSTDIRESVDSLCRDGADTPIVRVHRKAFLTCERSRSKPFWAPSYSIPVVLYPTIPLK